MEVANDKTLAPSLFDLVAPARAANEGPSFRDCLQTCPPPRQAEAPRAEPRSTPSKDSQPARRHEEQHRDEPLQTTDEPASARDREEEDESSSDESLATPAAASVQPIPQRVDLNLEATEQGALADVAAETPGDGAPLQLELPTEPAGDAVNLAAVEKLQADDIAANVIDTSLTDDAAGLAEGDTPGNQSVRRQQKGKVAPTVAKDKGVRQARDQAALTETSAAAAQEDSAKVDVVQGADRSVPSESQQESLEAALANEPPEPKKSAALDVSQLAAKREATTAVPATDGAAPTPAEQANGNAAQDAPPPAPVTGETVAASAPTAKPPAALLKAKSAHSEPTARPGEVNPERFLNRVAKAFASAHQRDSEVRLRLHPAELGSLSIEVHVQEGVLSARLQVETSEARTALVDNLPALRERLAEQGIRIEQFDVDLQDHSQRQQQSLREQFQDREAQREPTPRVANRRPAAEPNTAAGAGAARSAGPGGLNVII